MHFQPPPGYQPIYNPIIPYSGPIYGGLKEGMSVYIQGTVLNNVQFKINLQTGLEGDYDLALHFNPRLNYNVVVMNTREGGSWQSEEKPSEMPFHDGESFQLLFIVTSEGYQINVNGSDYHLYKHRMPIEKVCALSIGGGVSVHNININGGGIGQMPGCPGLGQMVGIPFTLPIYGGLRMGMSMHIHGAVPCDATRFHISLQTAVAKCSDKALYINPRFNPNEFVVFNTFKNTIFEEQEKVTDMPFTVGESFELVIIVTKQGYQVNVNGREFYMFKHRMPSTRVLALGIGGDVFVQSINITGGASGRIQAWPGPEYIGDTAHTQPIPGGLKEGMSLYLRGTIPSEDISRFTVDVQGGGDIALHFSPRFRGWSGVVFNTMANGGWHVEEKVDQMPFRRGKSFELVFFVTSEGYQVIVDGIELHMYKHRLPLDTVTDLVISGEVSVKTISIITEQEIVQEDPAPEDVNEEGRAQEYPAPGDVSSSAYSQSIDGGLVPGMSLCFEGTVHSGPNLFKIELMAGDDKAFHFNPRFGGSNVVVMNTCENGGWQSEEKPSEMPFREGKDFLLVYNVTSEGYQIIVNGSSFHTYKHRMPADSVTSLSIVGDVSVRSIIMNREPRVGPVEEFPAPGDVSTDVYQKPIEGGLKTGMILLVKGTVFPNDPNRFVINLEAGNDLAVHFNPRFRGWKLVAFNTRKNGGWQSEERPAEMPFKVGGTFDLLFNVTLKGYQVIVNGHTLHVYKHRIPVDQVTSLSIGGDVSIEHLAIIKTSLASGGSGYNWRFLPMMSSQPIYNPPVPYTKMIPGGMTQKMTIAFTGKVLPHANSIVFKFIASSTGEIAFYLNPRLNEGSVVRNSHLGGNWGSEERDFKFNPFQKGQHFEVMIRCGKLEFMVFANGKHMFNYFHRFLPFNNIDMIDISGDVLLSQICM